MKRIEDEGNSEGLYVKCGSTSATSFRIADGEVELRIPDTFKFVSHRKIVADIRLAITRRTCGSTHSIQVGYIGKSI